MLGKFTVHTFTQPSALHVDCEDLAIVGESTTIKDGVKTYHISVRCRETIHGVYMDPNGEKFKTTCEGLEWISSPDVDIQAQDAAYERRVCRS